MCVKASLFSTFHIVIYGEDEDLKNETSYFTGNYDEYFMETNEFSNLRQIYLAL